MKRFILRSVLFFFIIASLTVVLVLVSDYAVRQRESRLLKLSDEITMVFSGDSYVECAVDDNIVEHSINIAQSGEAYLYSYVKIKSLIENNNNIKAVFIGFSYGDMLMEKEIDWLCSDEFVVEKAQHYHYLLSESEKETLFKMNPKAYLKGVIKSVYFNLLAVLKSYYSPGPYSKLFNYGGYKHLVRNKLKADPEIKLQKNVPVKESALQVKYLRMISELCQGKSVKLMLFETPKYKTYNINVDDSIKKIWSNIRNSLAGDSLIDMSEFNMPDSCYGDLTHLNYRGAEVFSQYLNDQLNGKVNKTQ